MESSLPESIIVRMLHKIVPGGHFAFKIFFVYIFSEPSLQGTSRTGQIGKRKIAVGGFIKFHFIGIFHSIAETESAVVVKVIS